MFLMYCSVGNAGLRGRAARPLPQHGAKPAIDQRSPLRKLLGIVLLMLLPAALVIGGAAVEEIAGTGVLAAAFWPWNAIVGAGNGPGTAFTTYGWPRRCRHETLRRVRVGACRPVDKIKRGIYKRERDQVGGSMTDTWRRAALRWPIFASATSQSDLASAVAQFPGVRCGYRGGKPADPLVRGIRGRGTAMILAAAVVSDLMRRVTPGHIGLPGAPGDAWYPLRPAPIAAGRLAAHPRRVGLAIAAAVLTALGFAVLIVPGVMVTRCCFVALPACVVERLGPFQQHGTQRPADQGPSLEDIRPVAPGRPPPRHRGRSVR